MGIRPRPWHHRAMDVEATTRSALQRLRFPRSSEDRLVAGVAGGLAHRLEADPLTVRLCFVLLGLAGGVGVLAYAGAWLLSDPESEDVTATVRPERSVAVAALTTAALVVLRTMGIWPGDGLMIPAAIVAGGSALVWHDAHTSGRVRPGADPFERLMSGRLSGLRVVVGLVLTGAGLVVLAAEGNLRSVPRSAAALGVALVGVAVVLGPYAGRLLTDLRSAERERIRTEERAEIAAQLHDSVLQTLALMQRSSGDPRRMVLLARRQERELRLWLYGGGTPESPRTLAEHAQDLATEIELDHDLPVDLVVVGDCAVDDAARALLAAVREAAVNAAKHSDGDQVTIYVEVAPTTLSAFVRDKGRGFDASAVLPDRRGIAESIRGRLERCGGRSRLEATPGGGTEWELEVPR
jgi:signal transduction histidine kinase/phage shock protein PspC (stress-responsive transcriptional regulator)